MPKIGQTTRRDREVTAALAAWAEFEDPTAWRRSKRGNLWRNYDGMTLTIFKRKGDGHFGWSIANGEGPRFSPSGFETEADAIIALGESLGMGM